MQAMHDKDSTQLKLHKKHLGIINPQRIKPHDFRNEYERALAENASLKTAAAGNEEVQMPVQPAELMPMLLQ